SLPPAASSRRLESRLATIHAISPRPLIRVSILKGSRTGTFLLPVCPEAGTAAQELFCRFPGRPRRDKGDYLASRQTERRRNLRCRSGGELLSRTQYDERQRC